MLFGLGFVVGCLVMVGGFLRGPGCSLGLREEEEGVILERMGAGLLCAEQGVGEGCAADDRARMTRWFIRLSPCLRHGVCI